MDDAGCIDDNVLKIKVLQFILTIENTIFKEAHYVKCFSCPIKKRGMAPFASTASRAVATVALFSKMNSQSDDSCRDQSQLMARRKSAAQRQ